MVLTNCMNCCPLGCTSWGAITVMLCDIGGRFCWGGGGTMEVMTLEVGGVSLAMCFWLCKSGLCPPCIVVQAGGAEVVVVVVTVEVVILASSILETMLCTICKGVLASLPFSFSGLSQTPSRTLSPSSVADMRLISIFFAFVALVSLLSSFSFSSSSSSSSSSSVTTVTSSSGGIHSDEGVDSLPTELKSISGTGLCSALLVMTGVVLVMIKAPVFLPPILRDISAS